MNYLLLIAFVALVNIPAGFLTAALFGRGPEWIKRLVAKFVSRARRNPEK